jgi:membrane-bound lytic murein transglycosylase B
MNLIIRIQTQILNLKSYLEPRRVVAWPLFGQMAGLVLTSTALPFQAPVLAAEAPVPSVTLVLNTASVHQMVALPSNSTLKVTVVESKMQEKARLDREAQAKAIAEKTKSRAVAKNIPVAAPVVSGPTDVSLEQKRALVQKAAALYGLDWKMLEAVWQIESGKRWVTTVKSYAGAQGPMQFMPGTWRGYAVDGNGDGVANIYEAEDAVYAGARLLAANGGAENIDRALFAYNHAQWYVDKVKGIAASI